MRQAAVGSLLIAGTMPGEAAIPRAGLPRTGGETVVSLLLAAFVTVFGIMLPVNNLFDICYTRDLALNGLPTTALIGETQTCPSKPRPVSCHPLSFEVAGKRYTSRNARPDLSPGQVKAVLYAPLNPNYHRFSDRPSATAWDENIVSRLMISFGLGGLFTLAGSAFLWQTLKSMWGSRASKGQTA